MGCKIHEIHDGIESYVLPKYFENNKLPTVQKICISSEAGYNQ